MEDDNGYTRATCSACGWDEEKAVDGDTETAPAMPEPDF
jgi:hypothetical protein